MVKKYLKTGVVLVGAGAIAGAIPNISGTTTEAGLKTNFMTGLGNVGKVLPVYGSVVGTKMTLKSVGGLKKSTKFMLKGGKKL